jgi:hypothetical protein
VAGYLLRARADARVYTGVSAAHGGMLLVAHDAVPADFVATAEVARIVGAREWAAVRATAAVYAVPAPRGCFAILAVPTPEHFLNLADAAARGERANLRLAIPRPMRVGALVADVARRSLMPGDILRLPAGYGDRALARKIGAEAAAAAAALPRPCGGLARARCASCVASFPLAKIGWHATLCARGAAARGGGGGEAKGADDADGAAADAAPAAR